MDRDSESDEEHKYIMDEFNQHQQKIMRALQDLDDESDEERDVFNMLLLLSGHINIPSGEGGEQLQEEEENNTEKKMATEIMGIKIEKNPDESKLTALGVRSWPKWEGPPSKFPWTFASTETCYLLKGKVKVTVDGYDDSIEIGGGDLVVFPKGMKVTWEISEAVDKHYNLETSEAADEL